MALDLPFVAANAPGHAGIEAEPTHPVAVAFNSAGGVGKVWWKSSIPPGRGLGFSGSARVAGALLGFLQQGIPIDAAKPRALGLACDLEGHPDNAAASMLGGIVAAAGGRAIRITTPLELDVVVWWPSTATSTNKSRAALPPTVPFADAVFNVGRAALLVAALAAGDRGALSLAMEDRLHQDTRLDLSPSSRVALEAMQQAGVLACWLSGSGPTVAAFVERNDGQRVAALLPAEGTARVLPIDQVGARLVGTSVFQPRK
jgi:homoserine kinase